MKLVISFAAPLLLGVLFQQLYSFVDTAIVGRYLGASRLAAVSLNWARRPRSFSTTAAGAFSANQYSVSQRQSPFAGAVGPAFCRSRLSRISVIRSGGMRPAPTSSSVPVRMRTML